MNTETAPDTKKTGDNTGLAAVGVPLSVVVITKNEEANIEDCLRSVHGWADEIIVVDDESTDRTVALAEKYADKVFHRRMDNEGGHRNWAYAQARNEWVLSLDADEYVSGGLREEIREVLKSTSYHAFSVPLRNYIGDYWVRHSGWYPAGKLRLFMKSRFKYEEVEVHPRVFLEGETGHLTQDIVHKGYPDFEHFLASLNRQTTLEARKWIQTGRRMSLGKAVWRTLDRFPRVWIGKKGYKDGFIGFMIAFFASLYQIMSYAKYWEMKRRKG
jgi:glycosyltransferase involved in cell wall biosynthesis